MNRVVIIDDYCILAITKQFNKTILQMLCHLQDCLIWEDCVQLLNNLNHKRLMHEEYVVTNLMVSYWCLNL